MSEVTAEQLAAANPEAAGVAQAGVEAMATEPDSGKRKAAGVRAMRAAASRNKVELSDEDIDRIADALAERMDLLADALADRFDQRGAFTAPPPAMAAPASPAAEGQPDPAAAQEIPHRPTFAERFRGSR